MMQGISNLNTNKTKAADLKRLMQQACQTQRPVKQQQLLKSFKDTNTSRNHKKEPQGLKSKDSERSIKSISLISQLKELNLKKGLVSSSSGTIKNKQNIGSNIKEKNTSKLLSSLVLKQKQQNLNTEKSLKNLKLNASLEASKNILKTSSSSSTIVKEKKSTRYDFQQPKIVKRLQSIKNLPTINKNRLGLQDFELGRKLGKGRFGNVYVAQYKFNKFALAIKMINIKLLKESEMQSQLIEEIKLQSFMNHPNILKMYGFFHDSTNIYLLLELGKNCLFRQLRNKKSFSEEQAAYYIKQVIEGLKYMHSQSIIHRDIKPQNILITEGVIKLSDFGWSTYSPITKRQTFCGTLDYVPPEIVQGEYYDQKVDIWSLGVLCYELVIGKAPFQVPNDQQGTYDKILHADLMFPSYISQDLKDLISRILMKEPRDRLRLGQIEVHPWLMKYSTVGRYISKEIWEGWDSLR